MIEVVHTLIFINPYNIGECREAAADGNIAAGNALQAMERWWQLSVDTDQQESLCVNLGCPHTGRRFSSAFIPMGIVVAVPEANGTGFVAGICQHCMQLPDIPDRVIASLSHLLKAKISIPGRTLH